MNHVNVKRLLAISVTVLAIGSGHAAGPDGEHAHVAPVGVQIPAITRPAIAA